jgi:predicted metalloprotease with PDZ domain
MCGAPWSAAAKLPPWNSREKAVAGATALQGAFGARTNHQSSEGSPQFVFVLDTMRTTAEILRSAQDDKIAIRFAEPGRSSIFTHLQRASVQILLASFLLLALAAPLRAIEEPTPPPLQLAYHLVLTHPNLHLVTVEIAAGEVSGEFIDFVMPAWAPGRYAIYDFAKNVQEFEAEGAQRQLLPWTNLDKQTWRIDVRQAGGSVKARYRVFANDLSGSFSQFDSTHANLNGASIFMYVAGHKPDPITLSVDAPKDWQLISGFSRDTSVRAFHAPNYDRLVDTPIEACAEARLAQFQERGKTFRVAVHSYGEEDIDLSKLREGLQKIVHAEMALMPAPDFEHYTFIFHFAPGISMGDGMEHLNSTEIVIRGTLSVGLTEALETAAHEFFHVWNVKRLRPAALGPFDYTHEVYTPSLWLAEGVTSYVSYLSLLRAGLWSREQFLGRLSDEIRAFEEEPGRTLMSAESSSFHAWFYDRAPQMQETNFANSTISYYNKGALLGMLLDLEIQARTQGAKSLLDVMSRLYHEFYEAPQATYYGPGRGYEERDVLEAVNEVAGSDFTTFFDNYVRGTAPLPYNGELGAAGLALRMSVPAGSPPSIGITGVPENLGVRVFAVRPGGAADRAGLGRDDLLVAVDNQSLATEDFDTRLRAYLPGASVPFTVDRQGRREIISVTLDPPAPSSYAIQDLPGATPQQIATRNHWLGRGE